MCSCEKKKKSFFQPIQFEINLLVLLLFFRYYGHNTSAMAQYSRFRYVLLEDTYIYHRFHLLNCIAKERFRNFSDNDLNSRYKN